MLICKLRFTEHTSGAWCLQFVFLNHRTTWALRSPTISHKTCRCRLEATCCVQCRASIARFALTSCTVYTCIMYGLGLNIKCQSKEVNKLFTELFTAHSCHSQMRQLWGCFMWKSPGIDALLVEVLWLLTMLSGLVRSVTVGISWHLSHGLLHSTEGLPQVEYKYLLASKSPLICHMS